MLFDVFCETQRNAVFIFVKTFVDFLLNFTVLGSVIKRVCKQADARFFY